MSDNVLGNRGIAVNKYSRIYHNLGTLPQIPNKEKNTNHN